MTSIAVTGAAGSVGRRVVERLEAEAGVGTIRAFDRVAYAAPRSVDFQQRDIMAAGDDRLFEGCDSIVHLAEEPPGRRQRGLAVAMLDRVLAQAEQAGCPQVVLLSSALVYGAYPGNPLPLTEQHRPRPIPGCHYAVTKADLERRATAWAKRTGARLAILRPTATLSERGTSYIGGALREMTLVRPEAVDSPVQFLHHEDLASAVTLASVKSLCSVYNVAPGGWIGPEVFRDLLAEAGFAWPEPVKEAITRLGLAVPPLRVEPGLDAYVTFPWVIANDRLRSVGWEPEFSNEETFVLGHPQPGWVQFGRRRRQELTMAVLGLAAAATATAAVHLARSVGRVGRRG